jgi:hypothetical protein
MCGDHVPLVAALQPGMVQELATISDPTIDEEPGNIGSLQLWRASRCQSAFALGEASAQTALFYGLVSLRVSISTVQWWGGTLTKQTQLTNGEERAWTLFLFHPDNPVEVCLTITFRYQRSYTACTTSSLSF